MGPQGPNAPRPQVDPDRRSQRGGQEGHALCRGAMTDADSAS